MEEAQSHQGERGRRQNRSLQELLLQKFETEMDNFFALFRRYLQDKAKGTTLYVFSRILSRNSF